MYSAIGVFSVLLVLMMLVGFGIIGNDKITFTHEKCLDQGIDESACSVMQSLVDGESIDNWAAPGSVNLINSADSLGPVLDSVAPIELDLNTWTPSEVVNINSATICAISGQQLFLLLLSETNDSWFVEIALQLDEMGTNSLFGTTSYCQAHL